MEVQLLLQEGVIRLQEKKAVNICIPSGHKDSYWNTGIEGFDRTWDPLKLLKKSKIKRVNSKYSAMQVLEQIK